MATQVPAYGSVHASAGMPAFHSSPPVYGAYQLPAPPERPSQPASRALVLAGPRGGRAPAADPSPSADVSLASGLLHVERDVSGSTRMRWRARVSGLTQRPRAKGTYLALDAVTRLGPWVLNPSRAAKTADELILAGVILSEHGVGLATSSARAPALRLLPLNFPRDHLTQLEELRRRGVSLSLADEPLVPAPPRELSASGRPKRAAAQAPGTYARPARPPPKKKPRVRIQEILDDPAPSDVEIVSPPPAPAPAARPAPAPGRPAPEPAQAPPPPAEGEPRPLRAPGKRVRSKWIRGEPEKRLEGIDAFLPPKQEPMETSALIS